jgi:hypothetical protein
MGSTVRDDRHSETRNGNTNGKNHQGQERALPRELLNNGQGKCSVSPVTNKDSGSDMDISTESSAEAARTTQTRGMQTNELLLPPIINAMGHIATGATTELLRKQNKQQRKKLLLQQPIKTQWEQHHGETLLPKDHWEHRHKTAEAREMAPQGLALEHEAATILEDWEKFGCPTKMGRDWTLNETKQRSIADDTNPRSNRKQSLTLWRK